MQTQIDIMIQFLEMDLELNNTKVEVINNIDKDKRGFLENYKIVIEEDNVKIKENLEKYRKLSV